MTLHTIRSFVHCTACKRGLAEQLLSRASCSLRGCSLSEERDVHSAQPSAWRGAGSVAAAQRSFACAQNRARAAAQAAGASAETARPARRVRRTTPCLRTSHWHRMLSQKHLLGLKRRAHRQRHAGGGEGGAVAHRCSRLASDSRPALWGAAAVPHAVRASRRGRGVQGEAHRAARRGAHARQSWQHQEAELKGATRARARDAGRARNGACTQAGRRWFDSWGRRDAPATTAWGGWMATAAAAAAAG